MLVDNVNIEIKLYVKDNKQMVYLSHDGSNGCRYEYKDVQDLINTVADYIEYVYYDNN